MSAPHLDAAQAQRLFQDVYGVPPAGVWHAPGRVNLIGEHTDYNEGFVLPFALPWGVRVAARPAEDGDGDDIIVVSRQFAGVPKALSLGELRPGSVRGWAAYVAGVFWALRESGAAVGGAKLLIDADLPSGAGLSSSAAVECSVAIALNELYGLGLPASTLAVLSRRAENEFVGAATGGMDQNASLRCRAGHALFLDCRDERVTHVPFDLDVAGMRLLIIDTRVRHRLVDSEYAQRRGDCERAAELLGVHALRDVDDLDAALRELTDRRLRRRVRHVVTENHRVNATVGLARQGAIGEIGPLLNASHISLRDDFEVSGPELDAAVVAAMRGGARGARLTGGGFGGSVIALVPADRCQAVEKEVAGTFRANGWRRPEFRPATPIQGAHRIG